jgi:hypothetical protein
MLIKATCQLIENMCKKLRSNIGHHCTNIVKSLSLNLTHQHSKVRKATLITLGKLLVTESAGSNF